MKLSSIIAGISVFVTLGIVGGGLALYKQHQLQSKDGGHGFEPAETVRIVEASTIEWGPESDLVGTAFSLRSVRVSNEAAGRVTQVGFESGAIVDKGSTLLAFDISAEEADLAAAEATVRVAKASVEVGSARLRLAESEFKRVESAAADNAATEMELDRGRSEVERTRAEVDRLVAEVEQAESRAAQVKAIIAKKTVVAPFRGRAGIRTVHEGQYLAEGTPVVMLEEIADSIYLDFTIPQEYLSRVRPGLVVMATSAALGAEPVRIEVVAIDATVSNDTRNARVRGLVANPEGRIVPGMFVQIRVPVDAPKTYVMVPSTAVRRTSYADQVFVVGPAESPEKLRVKQRFVKLGPTVGQNVIVLEGLAAGEKIAAGGSFKLREGALVQDEATLPKGPPGGAAGGTAGGASPDASSAPAH